MYTDFHYPYVKQWMRSYLHACINQLKLPSFLPYFQLQSVTMQLVGNHVFHKAYSSSYLCLENEQIVKVRYARTPQQAVQGSWRDTLGTVLKCRSKDCRPTNLLFLAAAAGVSCQACLLS